MLFGAACRDLQGGGMYLSDENMMNSCGYFYSSSSFLFFFFLVKYKGVF
jgi:hypothetical protein